MGKLTMDEAQSIRQELADHKQNTDRVIEKLSQNMEKLTDTVTEIRVYQAELNSTSQRITVIESDVKALNSKISDMSSKLTVADSFVTSANRLMWGVAAAIILIVVKVVMDVNA